MAGGLSGGTGSARLAWHDRTAVSKAYSFQDPALAPHAATARSTYTCPAGKKAMLELLSARVERITVAGTPGYAAAYFGFTPSGGSGQVLLQACLRAPDNVAGNKDSAFLGGTVMLQAGDVLVLYTVDSSTTGTTCIDAAYKLTEFDA